MDEISIGPPLFSGRTADIYAWEQDYILKRFHEWMGLEAIQHEARISRSIHDSGLPVPLPGEIQSSLINALSRMPAGDRICHGDFHPGNVLLAEKGEVIIDWMDVTCGNPLADVASSTIIALGVAESEQISNAFLKVFARLFHALYIRHYYRLQPGKHQEYKAWLPIFAGARLSEGIPEVESWLVKQAQSDT